MKKIVYIVAFTLGISISGIQTSFAACNPGGCGSEKKEESGKCEKEKSECPKEEKGCSKEKKDDKAKKEKQ